uniref:Transposase n=1 Tax=Heterorhabditis bacteriophora TaxID=37862 RepID=A0A1I7WX94_HETBA
MLIKYSVFVERMMHMLFTTMEQKDILAYFTPISTRYIFGSDQQR